MFKCKECGNEYDIKPEYCDCGNDTFEEITQKALNIPEIKPKVTRIEIRNNPKKIQTQDYKPDYMSIGLIFLSIVISLGIIFLAWNNKIDKNISQIDEINTETEIINIPSVEKFWDDTPVKSAIKETPKPGKQAASVQNAIKEISQIVPKFVPKQEPKKQTVKAQSAVKQPTKNVTKNTVAPQKATVTQKTSQAKTQTPQKNYTPDAKNLTQRVQNNIKNTQITQNIQLTQAQTTHSNSTSTAAKDVSKIPLIRTNNQQKASTYKLNQAKTNPGKSASELKQELNSYKLSLRNTIAKKIDFTKVIGDGECALSFKINSSGTLTNRAFSQQSSNITLNDAVYSAMIATPKFNTPPQGYKNETLTLKIKIYNGNFEILLN